MNHLDDMQFVDAAEGHAQGDTAAHLAACASCALRVQELRAALRLAQSDTLPEPSPLFWTHFTQRVNAAIDAEAAPRHRWLSLPRLAFAAFAVLVIAAALLTMDRSVVVEEQEPPLADDTFVAQGADDIDADEAWAVVRSLADDLDYEEAHAAGVLPRAGAIERAAVEMNDAERAELARLIEAELKRTGP